ncbi:claudin-15 isoform X1 [Artibeus jamaicensis]|uniref:claudin-15 isoform X1 n=1 Tax=Artibeus jamaicensis TaxID=9417 RepID=UPI00235A488C|nr:claudin-15 isoform X1 [Artibeus jamaicensis]
MSSPPTPSSRTSGTAAQLTPWESTTAGNSRPCWPSPGSLPSVSPCQRPRGGDQEPSAVLLPRPDWVFVEPSRSSRPPSSGAAGYIQACRALMIIAILLGILGFFLGMVGLRCANIGGVMLSRKAKLAATAGALHILAGCCGMVAISWYASNITRDFFNPSYSGTKYELGSALYLGWSASLLAILGGACLCSNCCKAPDQDPATSTRLSYKAPTVRSAALAAHLPPTASDGDSDNSFGKYGKNAYV